MAIEPLSNLKFEIGHVLFVDIVGYSKLLINQQSELLGELNEVVSSTKQFRESEAERKLIRLPTGDGMALVFRNNPEAPALCALEISQALKSRPNIQLRMGVHSGPVNEVIDVNQRANIAGAGINMAQRVMDCGDAGHILLSKHVAEDLEQYGHWHPHLHDLGECQVKHGVCVSVVNLYTNDLGNPKLPEKFKNAAASKQMSGSGAQSAGRRRVFTGMVALVVATVAIALYLFWPNGSPPASSIAVPAKSIAVLPFENLSRDPENAYFTDGVQDQILTYLAKIADLKVISRTSVIQYKVGVARNLREIGQQLDVTHLLEGSVQRADGKVRVNAQLIEARTDRHLWAENYDRPLGDVFAIQSEIARTIADQLQAKLSPKEGAAIEKPPTTDIAAYDLYLRAKVLFADATDQIHAKEKLPGSARLLDEAGARDPQFLLAWVLLARVHGIMYFQGFDHTPGRLDLANVAIQNALRLQPDSGEAHLALADYYYHGFRDYVRARSELAIARPTLPNNAEVFEKTGYIDRREGHWEEATRNLEHAVQLDPRNFFILRQLALTYHFQGRYADEARTYERALTIVPGDPLTRISLAQVAFDWRADIKPFQTTLAALVAEDPSVAPDVDDPDHALCERTSAATTRLLVNDPREGVVTNGVNYPYAYWEGVVAHCQGDSAKAHASFQVARKEVEKSVEEKPDFASAISLLGIIDAGLGRKEEALREGRRACELLPIAKDAVDGVALAVNLAQIYAWTGEKDLAVKQIAVVESVPNSLSYGYLKLHPIWDSLRGDPGFEKIVASRAPRDGP